MYKKNILKIITLCSVFILIAFLLNLNIKANIGITELETYSKYDLKKLELPEEEQQTIMSSNINVDKEESNVRSLYSFAKSALLPARYDLRDYIDITIKTQGTKNDICWAFAANTMLETNINKATGEKYDFSDRHMDYDASVNFLDGINPLGLNRDVNTGGNIQMAFTYWTRGSGPILENDMPNVVYNTKINLSEMPVSKELKKVDDTKYFPNIYKNDKDGKIIYTNGSGEEYTQAEITEIRNDIKKHIMNYGGVVAEVHLNKLEEGYNSQTAALNYNIWSGSDHAVTIIGWDDNYSVDNFLESYKPSKPGAYIAINSWGSGWGDKGIVYISYEDYLVETSIAGVTNISDVDYDNLYQYDTNYMSLDASYINYAANVFERKDTNQEYLSEIMIGSAENQTCEVYVNSSDGELSSKKLVKISDHTYDLIPGYNTIKLDEEIPLTGEKFAVAVKIVSGKKGVGIEERSKNADLHNSNIGESYTGESLDRWSDIYDKNNMRNFCIKAYTKTEETYYELSELSYVTPKIVEGFGGVAELKFNTTAIQNGNQVIVKILKGSEDVTNNFEIIGNMISGNKANINIRALNTATAGTYTIEVKYKTFKETRTLTIDSTKSSYEIVKFNDKYLYKDLKEGTLSKYIILCNDKENTLLIEKSAKEAINEGILFTEYMISDLTGVEYFTNITYIGATDTKVKNFNILKHMPKLRALYSGSNDIDNIDSLKDLTSLTTIELFDNNINDISVLKNLTKLNEINLSNNKIRDIESLKDLNNITILNLSKQKIEDNIEIAYSSKMSEAKVPLPPIFIQAKTEDSLVYTDEDFTLTNCKLDGDNIVIDVSKLCENKEVIVKINEGNAKDTVYTLKYTVKENPVKSIKVTTPPTVVNYAEGQAFNKDGMVVTATYADDTEEIITDYTILNGKELLLDQAEVKVQYNGNSNIVTTQAITVEEKVLESLEITVPAKKTKDYISGQSFNRTGMIVTALYNNGTSKRITDYQIEDGKVLNKNQTSVTISYTENGVTKTVTQEINVIERKINRIAILKRPDKINELVNSDFNPDGMEVVLEYNDLTQEQITNYTILDGSDLDLNQTSVTIKYTEDDSLTTMQEISVSKKEVKSIDVTKSATQTTYVEGQSFKKDGLVVTATYNDDTTGEIDDYEIIDGDNLKLEQTNVIIRYLGDINIQTTTTINVIERKVVSIKIDTEPSCTSYIEGQDFNAEGLVIKLIYNDDSEEISSDYTVLEGDNLEIGQESVIVQYNSNTALTVEQPIIVNKRKLDYIIICGTPIKTSYVEGQDFETLGMEVLAVYNDDTNKTITDYIVEDGKNLEEGQTTVTISYTEDGVTEKTTQTITVEKRKISSIMVTTPPSKVDYKEGEKFNADGMVVKAVYNDESEEKITDYTVVDGEDLEAGQTTVTIKYQKLKTTQAITVQPKALDNIEITKAPTDITYVEGEEFNPAGMIVKANYNNSDSEEITDYIVVDGENLEAGQTTVTISYTKNGVTKTATQGITVEAKVLKSIEITKAPTNTTYIEGAEFNPAGMVVKAIYNNSEEEIIDYIVLNGEALEAGQTTVTISYTKNNVTQTVTQKITVQEKVLESIKIANPPTKTRYIEGENFNSKGMIVKAVYNNESEEEIINYTVENGSGLSLNQETVTIKYQENGITKTVTQKITVLEKSTQLYTLIDGAKISLNTENAVITGIQPGEKAEYILSQFENILDGVTIKVYKKYEEGSSSNVELGVNEKVGTGMKLVVEKTGEKPEEYTIVIYGDVNGDGNISMSDITAIIKHIVRKSILTNEKLVAANVDKDINGQANMSDITTIIKHIVRKTSIEQ